LALVNSLILEFWLTLDMAKKGFIVQMLPAGLLGYSGLQKFWCDSAWGRL